MNKKYGFTLVELLSVIIIIGLLATILIPNVSNIIDKAKSKTFKEDAKAIIRSAENYFADNEFSLQEGECVEIQSGEIELKEDSRITDGKVCIIDSQPYLMHITNGSMCVSGHSGSLDVYPCGEKNVVIFSGDAIGESTTPIKNIPRKAFIIKNGDKLIDHIGKYKETLYGMDFYNFWGDINNEVYPYLWDNEFNDNTIVSNDIVYNAQSIYRKNIVTTGLTDGKYYIYFVDDQRYTLGYDGTNNFDLLLVKKNKFVWTLNKYSNNNFIFYAVDNKGLDIKGANYAAGTNIILYDNTYGQHNQRFDLINNNTNRGYYTIKTTNNDNFYFGFDESNLAINNQIKLVSNSSSNIKQFVFVKAE